jgi:hypothetical protein
MRSIWLGAILLAACGDHGFALDLDVEPGCLMPSSIVVTATAPPGTPQMQTLDGPSFFAGRHHVVVLVPDGVAQLTVEVAAFDGATQLADRNVVVPIGGPGLESETLALDDGCMDGSVGDLGEGDGFADGGDSATITNCPGAKCVFVSSQTFDGNLGDIGGADGKCQSLASAVGLQGTYRAWISDSNGSVLQRFTMSTIPYHLVDGTLVANNWTDLTSGALRHAISLTETGGPPPATTVSSGHDVWTDTTSGAGLNVISEGCGDWNNAGATGVVGDYTQTSGAWTFRASATGCSGTATLYCFEQ